MRREAWVVAVLGLLTGHVSAYDTVYDPVNHGTAVWNEIVNLAKYGQQLNQQTQIALNTVHTYENTATQLIRAGNPAALRSLPGISEVANLVATGQEVMQEYRQLQAYVNPQYYQATLNSVLNEYQRPSWNGFTTAGGYYVPSNAGLYQFQTATYQAFGQTQKTLETIQQERQTLQVKRDAAQRLVESASTAADVQKHTAQLAGLNAAIAELDQRSHQAAVQAQIQERKNAAAEALNRAAQQEQADAGRLQQVDRAFGNLPTDIRQTVNWNN